MCHGVAFFQVLPPGRSRNRRSFPWRIQSQEEKPNWAVILVDRPLTIPRLRCPQQTGCCNLRAVLSPPYSRNGAASRSGELPPAGSGTRRERSERHRQGDPDRRGHPVTRAFAPKLPQPPPIRRTGSARIEARRRASRYYCNAPSRTPWQRLARAWGPSAMPRPAGDRLDPRTEARHRRPQPRITATEARSLGTGAVASGPAPCRRRTNERSQ